MIRSFKLRLPGRAGFTLIEMAIVLLIAGLLVAGITQIMTSSQKTRNDQAVANEVKTVVSALERFTVDQQAALTGPMPNSGNYVQLSDSLTGAISLSSFAQNYLPQGLQCTVDPAISGCTAGTSPYLIGIARQNIVTDNNGSRPSFRALLLRVPDNAMDDSRLSRVASLIGTQGGMVSNSAASPFPISGVMGSWQVNNPATSYGITPSSGGMIAALTNTVDAQISVNTLSRLNPAGTGQSEGNTMRTDLYMGGSSISGNDAYAIHNSSGVGYALTNAYVGSTSTTLNYYAIGSGGPNSGTALGSFTPDNFATVTGYTDNNYSTPVLLQNINGTWQLVGSNNSVKTWHVWPTPNYSNTYYCTTAQANPTPNQEIFVSVNLSVGQGQKMITLWAFMLQIRRVTRLL